MTTIDANNLAQGDSTSLTDSALEESNVLNTPPPHGDTEEIIQKASDIKEHDVIDEELKQADKIQGEIESELAENDGWIQILGNDQLTKKVLVGL